MELQNYGATSNICTNYACYIGYPFQSTTLQDATLILISRTEVFGKEYMQFCAGLAMDQYFADLKIFFHLAHANQSKWI